MGETDSNKFSRSEQAGFLLAGKKAAGGCRQGRWRWRAAALFVKSV